MAKLILNIYNGKLKEEVDSNLGEVKYTEAYLKNLHDWLVPFGHRFNCLRPIVLLSIVFSVFFLADEVRFRPSLPQLVSPSSSRCDGPAGGRILPPPVTHVVLVVVVHLFLGVSDPFHETLNVNP